MNWNVQNLFDDVDNGTEYRDFDPGEEEWTMDMFHAKMLNLGEVIESAVPRGADILALQEVENENTLVQFRDIVLKGLGYRYSAISESPGAAVNTAFLSKYPITVVRAHALHTGAAEGLRHVLEVEIEIAGETLYLLNNHCNS
jgi:endonuclease/exonuclease/phosphatase family metal-dependent hydrolase